MSIGLARSLAPRLASPQYYAHHYAAAPYHLAAVAVLVVVASLRLLYLSSLSELSLASDEAHYWDWSRHLDWCYYSKGPLVAWLIRAGCWFWGADVMPAVRLPAVLCNALTLLGIYLLVYRLFRDARLAFLALLAGHTLPLLNVGGLMMTIDAPYTCAWTWAVYLAHRLLFPRGNTPYQTSEVRKSQRGEVSPGTRPSVPEAADMRRFQATGRWWYTQGTWLVLGLVVAVGVLAKHNMALFVPSLGLFLLLSPAHRRELRQPGFWLMAILGAIVGGGPILLWNAQHDWVTFLHVGTQATGVSAGGGLRWFGPLEFLATQAGLWLIFWFCLMLLGCFQVLRQYVQGNVLPQQLFLVCLALPMLLICLVFSIKVRIEPNWPVTAYVTGLILAGWMLWERWHLPTWRRTTYGWLLAGALFSVILHQTAVLYPLVAHFLPEDSPRRWDPTCP
ncbi:MAG TPA: glycosyltransferase family 39 protein, partial [Gemmatales bacterium]|nr:glycosyltransferase family 39 protein [Gemmatales bacterium]